MAMFSFYLLLPVIVTIYLQNCQFHSSLAQRAFSTTKLTNCITTTRQKMKMDFETDVTPARHENSTEYRHFSKTLSEKVLLIVARILVFAVVVMILLRFEIFLTTNHIAVSPTVQQGGCSAKANDTNTYERIESRYYYSHSSTNFTNTTSTTNNHYHYHYHLENQSQGLVANVALPVAVVATPQAPAVTSDFLLRPRKRRRYPCRRKINKQLRDYTPISSVLSSPNIDISAAPTRIRAKRQVGAGIGGAANAPAAASGSSTAAGGGVATGLTSGDMYGGTPLHTPNYAMGPPPEVFARAFSCAARGTGLYPDPWDCSRYYWCDQADGIQYKCPPGMLFATDRQRCMQPHMVDCVEPIEAPEPVETLGGAFTGGGRIRIQHGLTHVLDPPMMSNVIVPAPSIHLPLPQQSVFTANSRTLVAPQMQAPALTMPPVPQAPVAVSLPARAPAADTSGQLAAAQSALQAALQQLAASQQPQTPPSSNTQLDATFAALNAATTAARNRVEQQHQQQHQQERQQQANIIQQLQQQLQQQQQQQQLQQPQPSTFWPQSTLPQADVNNNPFYYYANSQQQTKTPAVQYFGAPSTQQQQQAPFAFHGMTSASPQFFDIQRSLLAAAQNVNNVNTNFRWPASTATGSGSELFNNAALAVTPARNAPGGSQSPLGGANICSSGMVGLYADVSSGCRDYFFCGPTGQKVDFQCPSPLLFSDATKGCDQPNRVPCIHLASVAASNMQPSANNNKPPPEPANSPKPESTSKTTTQLLLELLNVLKSQQPISSQQSQQPFSSSTSRQSKNSNTYNNAMGRSGRGSPASNPTDFYEPSASSPSWQAANYEGQQTQQSSNSNNNLFQSGKLQSAQINTPSNQQQNIQPSSNSVDAAYANVLRSLLGFDSTTGQPIPATNKGTKYSLIEPIQSPVPPPAKTIIDIASTTGVVGTPLSTGAVTQTIVGQPAAPAEVMSNWQAPRQQTYVYEQTLPLQQQQQPRYTDYWMQSHQSSPMHSLSNLPYGINMATLHEELASGMAGMPMQPPHPMMGQQSRQMNSPASFSPNGMTMGGGMPGGGGMGGMGRGYMAESEAAMQEAISAAIDSGPAENAYHQAGLGQMGGMGPMGGSGMWSYMQQPSYPNQQWPMMMSARLTETAVSSSSNSAVNTTENEILSSAVSKVTSKDGNVKVNDKHLRHIVNHKASNTTKIGKDYVSEGKNGTNTLRQLNIRPSTNSTTDVGNAIADDTLRARP